MGGDLPIQNGASSSPNSYELFSKSAVTFFETIINVNKKLSDNARFSFTETKADRLRKLKNSKPIIIKSKDVKIRFGADLKTRKKDAYNIGIWFRGTYYNDDTGDAIKVVERSIAEYLRHDVGFEQKEDVVNVSFAHLLSVSKLPEIIKKAIYIDSIPNEDPKNEGKIDSFDYYFVGLKIDGIDYTAKLVVAKNSNGQKYYDHALTKIEKGKLLWHLIKPLSRGSDTSRNLPYDIRGKRIFSLLQEKKSDNARFSFTDDRSSEAQRQYDEVVAKYKDTDQWLKAPNGQPTKLTEKQWVMVRMPNFKKWFGDWEKKAWAEEAIKFLEANHKRIEF